MLIPIISAQLSLYISLINLNFLFSDSAPIAVAAEHSVECSLPTQADGASLHADRRLVARARASSLDCATASGAERTMNSRVSRRVRIGINRPRDRGDRLGAFGARGLLRSRTHPKASPPVRRSARP